MPYQVVLGAAITTEGVSPLRVVYDWDAPASAPDHAYICILQVWIGDQEISETLSDSAINHFTEKIGRGMQKNPPTDELRAFVAEEMKENRLQDPVHGWIMSENWGALTAYNKEKPTELNLSGGGVPAFINKNLH